jgi:hypothetical protein
MDPSTGEIYSTVPDGLRSPDDILLSKREAARLGRLEPTQRPAELNRMREKARRRRQMAKASRKRNR